MTANNAATVSVGKANKTGAAFSAPLGTTLPTNATAKLGTAFTNHGYVGADGLTNSVERDSADINAWGGDTVLTTQTSYKETYKLKLIQSLDEDTLKTAYGDANVTAGTNGITVAHGPVELPAKVWAFEVLMTGNMLKRIVIPKGKIIEIGEVVYKDDEEVGYEITIGCMPDGQGNTSYEYIAQVASASGSGN